jgi:hypothetical protein
MPNLPPKSGWDLLAQSVRGGFIRKALPHSDPCEATSYLAGFKKMFVHSPMTNFTIRLYPF